MLRTALFYKTLVHGDPMVLDRWRWLRGWFAKQRRGRVLDVGCGGGAFCFGLSRIGFQCTGLSWDNPRMLRASKRAAAIGVSDNVTFTVQDARHLDQQVQWRATFDYVVCTENIEHILDDHKLMRDMAMVMKDGGLLFLTTPNKNYVPIGDGDSKDKLSLVEDGGHVRVGYDENDVRTICSETGFEVVSIDYCSGFVSQKLTGFHRIMISYVGTPAAWAVIFPLRLLPLLCDSMIGRLFGWPGYSICLVARRKPRQFEEARERMA